MPIHHKYPTESARRAAEAAESARAKKNQLAEGIRAARKQALNVLGSACSLAPVDLVEPATWLALVSAASVAATESLESHPQRASLRIDFAKASLPVFATLAERALKADPRREPVWGPELARLAFASAAPCAPEEALIAAYTAPLPLFERLFPLFTLTEPQRRGAAIGLAQKDAPALAASLLGAPEAVIGRVDPHQTHCYLSLAAESSLGFKEIKRRANSPGRLSDPETLSETYGQRLAKAHGDGSDPSPLGAALLKADPALLPPLERASLRELSLLAYLFLNERDLPAYLSRLEAIAPATGETISLHPEDMRALRAASWGSRVATHAARAAARTSLDDCVFVLGRAKSSPTRALSLLENILPGVRAAFKRDPASLLRDFPDKPDHSVNLGVNLAELTTRAVMLSKAEPGAPGTEAAVAIFELCLRAGYSSSTPPPGRSHSLASKLLTSKNALAKAWASAWEAQEIACGLSANPSSRPSPSATVKPMARRGLSL